MDFIELVSPNSVKITAAEGEEKIIDRIELAGTDSLSVCTLLLFNGDELTENELQKVIFTKSDHPTECILTPHKLINFSAFSYYSFKIFSGNLHSSDKVLLFFA